MTTPREPNDRRIAAVIVTYNSADCVEACLDSLRSQRGVGSISVWDNDSRDGTAALLRRYPGLSVHQSPTNVGFAAAVNRAAANVPGNLLLLNPDAALQPGAVSGLRRVLEFEPSLAVVGCQLVSPGGEHRSSAWRFPTPRLVTIGSLFGLGAAYRPRLEDRGLWFDMDDAFVPFTACLVRRHAFDALGALDEDFFVYGEDADFCYRARRAGWRVGLSRTSVATHIGQHSDAGGQSSIHQLRGGELFARKHFSAEAARRATSVQHFGARLRLSPLGRALIKDADEHAPGWRAAAAYYRSSRDHR